MRRKIKPVSESTRYIAFPLSEREWRMILAALVLAQEYGLFDGDNFDSSSKLVLTIKENTRIK